MKNFTHSFRLLTLLAALFVMSASAMASTKTEDFEKATATGTSYKDVAFDGFEAGITWTGKQVRTDVTISGLKAIMLKKDVTSKLTSSSISGGIKNLTFKYKQAFSNAANFNVVIGSQTYGPYKTTDTNVQTATIENINLAGDFTIEFSQVNASSAQVLIDDLSWETYGSATTPTASFVGTGDFGAVETGNTVDLLVAVKGANLTGDLTVAVSGAGFSSTKATLSQSEVESEIGCQLPIKFMASASGVHAGSVTISGGGLLASKTLDLSATVYEVTKVHSLAALLANQKGETVYQLASEATIIFINKASVYLHDATATTLLYNGNKVVPDADIAVGHNLKDLKVKIDEYNGAKQLVPVAMGTIPSQGNVIPEPEVTTVEALVANPLSFAHKLIVVHNVTMENKAFGTPPSNNTVTGVGGTATVVCRDNFAVLQGFTPPAAKISLIGFVEPYSGKAQIYPRSTDDISTFVSAPSLDAVNTKVYATAGRVVVETESAARVEIFNTVGQAVKVVTVNGTATINLNKGLYIVRVNGKSVKVLVR